MTLLKSLPVLFLFTFFCTAAQAADIRTDSVKIRLLDKITGRSHVKEINIGDTEVFEDLRITPFSCFTKPPEDTPENAAFFEIELHAKSAEPKTIFKGWMFSSSPAISALEHPVYDIWVLQCTNPQPQDATDLPPEAPHVTIQRTEDVVIIDDIPADALPVESGEDALPFSADDANLHGIEVFSEE